MRLIDADRLIKVIEKAQFEGSGNIMSIINDAPTVEPRTEYGTDGQAYRLFISGGQVVPDMLQGWKYEERPTGEWEWVQYDANPNIGNWHCSECRYIPHGKKEYQKTNFCPNCGADMRKETENE